MSMCSCVIPIIARVFREVKALTEKKPIRNLNDFCYNGRMTHTGR